MKNALRILTAAVILSPFLSGCISGFDREAAETRFEAVNIDNSNQDISIIKTPLKVAVFGDMETMSPPDTFEETWDWSRGDKQLMVSYLNNLEELGYISDYFVINDRPELSMQDISQLLMEAEKQNADVLLTVRGIIQVNSYFNPAAILDLTILGACLFPGSNRDIMLMVRMNLWNVKDKSCILTVKGEGVKKISEPTFLIDTEGAVNSVKRDTLGKVLAEFKKRCRDIKPPKQLQ